MKPTSLLSVLLVTLCISVPAFAKEKKAAPAPKAPPAAAAPAPAYSSGGGHSSSTIHWSVTGPFQLLDGTAMFGANINGDYNIKPDITVGGESGFMIGSTNSVTIWEIPIVVVGKYHFAMQSMPNWKPYAGLGLGLSILHAGAPVPVGLPPGTSTSDTSAKFRGELKVGTSFQDGPGLMAEIKLGLVSDSFLFAPSIGWAF